MAHSVTPFLMFQGDAEEAMNLYVTLFADSEIVDIVRYGPDGPGMDGDVLSGQIRIAGQNVMCIDSPGGPAVAFTPAMSLFVICESEEEIGSAFAKLAEGGQVMMPLAAYEFSPAFGWVQDRFGVSWQLSLHRA